jgi:hypothetical protein
MGRQPFRVTFARGRTLYFVREAEGRTALGKGSPVQLRKPRSGEDPLRTTRRVADEHRVVRWGFIGPARCLLLRLARNRVRRRLVLYGRRSCACTPVLIEFSRFGVG